MEKLATIYYVDCAGSWKGYVGSTISPLAKRKGQHKYLLRRGIHFNRAMQEDFNKYGWGSFSFIPLEQTNVRDRYVREQYHIKRLGTNDPAIGYNHYKAQLPHWPI